MTTTINISKNPFIKGFVRFCIAAVISVTAVLSVYFLWRDGAFLPRWIKWKEKTVSDTGGSYNVSLCDKTVRVTSADNAKIWETTANIKVQDVFSADIDYDNEDELVILCWKVGRYGDARPFWVDDAEAETGKWSQHIFTYEYRGEKIKPKWMSSYLGTDVYELSVDNGRLIFYEKSGKTSVWRWNSWGFERIGG